jgi:Protein of unknown function (DUF998)
MITEILSIIFAIIFLALLIILHFIKKELNPIWRMISEYEIGKFGWIMRVAFFCWGISVLFFLISFWPFLQSVTGMIGKYMFIIIFISLIGAGIFKTDPITENNPNLENTLHVICGAIVIITFPITSTLVVNNIIGNEYWPKMNNLMIIANVIVWIGLITFFASIIISKVIDPKAGKIGMKVYLGWPNRFMVFTYILWLIILAATKLQSI